LNDSGLDASIREGRKSQFDVLADGELVFSKQAVGRWPEDGEVRRLLSSR
jgi:hypothetical protein